MSRDAVVAEAAGIWENSVGRRYTRLVQGHRDGLRRGRVKRY